MLWHCWLRHVTHKIVSEMTYNVSSETLNPTIPWAVHVRKIAWCIVSFSQAVSAAQVTRVTGVHFLLRTAWVIGIWHNLRNLVLQVDVSEPSNARAQQSSASFCRCCSCQLVTGQSCVFYAEVWSWQSCACHAGLSLNIVMKPGIDQPT